MPGIDEAKQFVPLKIAVLTVSDTRNLKDDKSGALLVQRIGAAGHVVAERSIVPDDVEAIRARFEPKGWDVRPFRIRSRPASGTFVPEPPPKKRLHGCELMGSRPFEHLHVTATAKAVLCCQDYYERLTVGDLSRETVRDLLGGDTMARLRRWTYGVEEAPEDFLCRRCEFAIGE